MNQQDRARPDAVPAWPAWLFAAVCLIVAALFLLAPMREVVLRFVPDDAFFYLGIAREWNRHGFSTFDGINPTNGYHPLWEWMLLAAADAFSSADAFVRFASVAGVVFFAGATILVVQRLAREKNSFRGIAYVWVAGTLLLATIYAMEAPVTALALALVIAALPRGDLEWPWTHALACGAATALLFLARIDALIWLAALDVVLLATAWRAGTRRSLGAIVLIGVVQVLVAAVYFAGNWLAWGHVLPISAALKSARSPLFSLTVPRSLFLLLTVGITGAGLVPLLEFGAAVRRGHAARIRALVTPAWLALSNLAFVAVIAAKGGPETYNWYFALSVFSGAYLVPFAIDRYGSAWTGLSRAALARWGMAACFVLLIASAHSKVTKLSQLSIGAYDKALALAAYPEESLTLAATDCGILGYFSRQRVMNVDGLTNSWEFQAALADGQLAAWLAGQGLNAYVAPPHPEAETVVLRTFAGLASGPQVLRLRVESMEPRPRLPAAVRVYRVTGIDPPTELSALAD